MAPAVARRHGQPHEVQHRRRDVDQPRQSPHAQPRRQEAGRAARGPGGRGDDHRHVEGGAVNEDAVGGLAVIAERFAVVGEIDDQGALAQALRVERVEQPRDLRVGVQHLTGVGSGCPAPELVRRRVRLVRIVEMHPQVEGPVTAALPAEPVQGAVHDKSRRPLDLGETAPLDLGVVEGVVVGLVTLGQAPSRGEDVGADDRRGLVAVPAEPLGEGGDVLSQHEAGVVAHAVMGRVEAREDRGVGREGQGNVRDRALEQNALPGEARGGGRVEGGAVGSHVVAPQRVDGDHDHVDVGIAGSVRRRVLRRPDPTRQRGRSLSRLMWLGRSSAPDVRDDQAHDKGQRRGEPLRPEPAGHDDHVLSVSERARRDSVAPRSGSGPAGRRSGRPSIPPGAARRARGRPGPRPHPARSGGRRPARPPRGR
jgi:hypothetical protein